MTVGTLQIDARKLRIVPEEQYRAMSAAMRAQQQEAREDVRDLTVARRRLKDPKRKTIPLPRFKSDLGL
jgi:hypothetical protein